MRIALVGPFSGASLAGRFEFDPSSGPLPGGYPGAPLMTVLAAALVERGHEVGVISTDYAADPADRTPFRRFGGERITAYFCPQRPHSFRGAGGQRGRALDLFAAERARLKSAIEDFKPDVIHAHWTYEFAWAALDTGYPCLVTAHDSPWKVLKYTPNPYRAMRYLMARRVIARCKALTAVSPDLKADLEGYGVPSVTVVANPIDDAVLASEGCTPQASRSQTLLMVLNGWNPLKNGTTALKGFAQARARHPGLKLICFGNGYEPQGEGHRWAQANRLDAGVEFRGPVPHGTILAQMRESTALLHPSRWEACCMAIAESMSLGLPVIGGKVTDGVPWQLDGGRAGVLVDVMSAADIARGIESLVSDPEHWSRISAAARQRARTMFTIDSVVDGYLGGYRQALARA